MDEVREKLKKAIMETSFQRDDRLDKEFEALSMARMTHVEFRSLWEEKLDEMEDAEIMELSLPSTVKMLHRKYLSKLTDELRSTVLSKVWPLDGEQMPSRKPATWEEVAQAVDYEIGSRADAKAPKDTINVFGEAERGTAGGAAAARCKDCGRGGHLTESCPQTAAKRRGELESLLADSERTGRTCTVCGQADHREIHHRLANSDANYTVGQDGSKLSWNGGGVTLPKGQRGRDGTGGASPLDAGAGGGRGGGGGGGKAKGGARPKGANSELKCNEGIKCRFLLFERGCKY